MLGDNAGQNPVHGAIPGALLVNRVQPHAQLCQCCPGILAFIDQVVSFAAEGVEATGIIAQGGGQQL